MHFYLLSLLAVSLLHITASTVHYVMPDNHYHPINDNTYTLQHYLSNTNKYFTSNTQLHFLPGQYYLNNDLMIQVVSNFSLIGNRTNEVINTVINCTSPAGIVVVNSSNIVITNIVMNDCGNDYSYKPFMVDIFQNQNEDLKSVFILNSKSTTVMYVHLLWHQKLCGLEFVNALDTKLSNLISNYLLIWYIGSNSLMVNKTDTLFIEKFQTYSEISDVYTIKIEWYNTDFDFITSILNVNFTSKLALHITCLRCLGNNTVTVKNCHFNDMVKSPNSTMNSLDSYKYPLYYYDDIHKCHDHSCDAKVVILYFSQLENYVSEYRVYFNDCNFINNFRARKLLLVNVENSYSTTMPLVLVNNGAFYGNKYVQLLLIRCKNGDVDKQCASIFLKNITIMSNTQYREDVIYIYHVILTIENVKIINNTFLDFRFLMPYLNNYNIILAEFSYLKFTKYNEISFNSADSTIRAPTIHICENSILNLSSNTLGYNVEILYSLETAHAEEIDTCAIQYISKRGNLDKEFQMGQKLNYSIIHNNINDTYMLSNIDLNHCEWDLTSAFLTSSPLHVNQHFIQQKISEGNQEKQICLCCETYPPNCYIEELGSFYPGVTVTLNLIIFSTSSDTVLLQQNDVSAFACRGKVSTVIDCARCKNLSFTLTHKSGTWCELYLRALPVSPSNDIGYREIFTIIFLPCPKGFSLHSQGNCECDQILSSYIPSLIHCNINDQTIPRPANSWISAHTDNNSHSYHVSLHCPFDYCLPHSSLLNLSTPEHQCQFDRSGLLCGQCQQGLSAVFGSSQCKHCSNVYLLIIIPIVIAGIVLVLSLFVLNLNVTNGDINAFLLYANIIGINISIFLPINEHELGTVLRTFISLANLDLGITTCFYDGMDEYAKIWLQLLFPAYLILIATAFIIMSRYSIRIQRLTACRALPILATLFLLSYTKILITVSNVLFFYSTITYLPSNHTSLVWSVDANLPLLEIKFIILFITCAILFIVLIAFNVLLIFSRQFSRFRYVNYFKPLLDAYQGPYKIKFYFWTGLHLLVRAIIFGLSALDKNTYLTISIILFGILLWLTEKLSPFKNQVNNTLEVLYILNLMAVFTISLHTTASKHTTGIIIGVLVSLAMFMLLCIIVIHVKNCCGTNINENNCGATIKKLTSYFMTLRGASSPPKSIELVNAVPEVKYNYKEFQEPLIGQD